MCLLKYVVSVTTVTAATVPVYARVASVVSCQSLPILYRSHPHPQHEHVAVCVCVCVCVCVRVCEALGPGSMWTKSLPAGFLYVHTLYMYVPTYNVWRNMYLRTSVHITT